MAEPSLKRVCLEIQNKDILNWRKKARRKGKREKRTPRQERGRRLGERKKEK